MTHRQRGSALKNNRHVGRNVLTIAVRTDMFSRYSLLPYRTTHLDSMCDVAYFREGRVALCAHAAASRAAAGSGAGPGLGAGALPALDELHGALAELSTCKYHPYVRYGLRYKAGICNMRG